MNTTALIYIEGLDEARYEEARNRYVLLHSPNQCVYP